MKIACQERLLPGVDAYQRFENAKKFGFEGVEVDGAELLQGRFEEIRDASKKTGVPVSTICAGYRGCLLDPDPEERQLAMNDIKELLCMGGELGARGLIVVPIFFQPRLPDLSPYKDQLTLEKELVLVLLDELADVAESSNCLILLEPLNRYETHFLNRLEQAVELAKQVGKPSVKIMADFFHMSIEEIDIPKAIKEAGNYIAHIHLADSTRLTPGYGHTDFRAGFVALAEIGYKDFMALECGVPGDPAVELPKTVEYLKKQME